MMMPLMSQTYYVIYRSNQCHTTAAKNVKLNVRIICILLHIHRQHAVNAVNAVVVVVVVVN